MASDQETLLRPARTDGNEQDRLQVVRDYLGSLAGHLQTNGDAASRHALAEALASIESVAADVRGHGT